MRGSFKVNGNLVSPSPMGTGYFVRIGKEVYLREKKADAIKLARQDKEIM